MSLKSSLMPLYRRSPAAVKNLFGTVYGHYLNYWRYGPRSEALVHEALERESWSAERWESWQGERLAALLHGAASNVPYYREHWRARRARGDTSPVDRLENWPLLDKSTLRANAAALVAEHASTRSMFKLETSGTSGTPITTWRSREALRQWYALVEARWRRWYGVTRFDNWGILGGQEVAPVDQSDPPFWLWNGAGNQLYMSSLHLKPKNIPAYVRAMTDHEVVHLYGYSSSLAELARMALDQGLKLPQMKAVVTNAEPLEPYQRTVMSEAFGPTVHSSYGMSEAVAAASECSDGALHLWPEVGVVEVFADGSHERVPSGSAGRLVCTGLLNPDMPLIRYVVGDRGALEPSGSVPVACGCGRAMPRLARLEGRNVDNLVTADGRKVFWVNPVLYGLPIAEGQIVQEAVDRIVVNVVPAAGFDDGTKSEITDRLRLRLGPIDVTFKTVDAIPRGANGKFRAVINQVPGSAGSTGSSGSTAAAASSGTTE
jgi:phenylacetate-CoA ligase